MRPIEGFGIPGFFHPIDRRKSEQFVSFLYTTYRGIRKSGLFSDQFGPEIRVFWQVTLRNPGFLGKLLSEIRLFSDLKNYPSIGGVHILSGIAQCSKMTVLCKILNQAKFLEKKWIFLSGHVSSRPYEKISAESWIRQVLWKKCLRCTKIQVKCLEKVKFLVWTCLQ